MPSSPRRAVVLHDIADAAHCLEEGLHRDSLLLSTSTAVDVWLSRERGLACVHVSSVLSDVTLGELRDEAGTICDALLRELELDYGVALALAAGEDMPFFEPVYAYLLRYQVDGYLAFSEGLRRIVSSEGIEEVRVFDRTFTEFLECSTRAVDLTRTTGIDARIEPVTRVGVAGQDAVTTPRHEIRQRSLGRIARRLPSKMREQFAIHRLKRFSPRLGSVVLNAPLYGLDFLARDNLNRNVLYYPHASWQPLGHAAQRATGVKPFVVEGCEEPGIRGLVRNEVLQDASARAELMVGCVRTLADLHRKSPIELGVWGGSPVTGPAALTFSYLAAQGVETIGAQHGATYGEAIEPWHFESDFDRCDRFISWGFSGDDLRRMYPGRTARCKVEALGNPLAAAGSGSKCVDVLFPMTFSRSIFNGGPSRTEASRLRSIQEGLLLALDSLDTLSAHVKPLAYYDEDSLSVAPMLESLKHATWIKGVTLCEYLAKHAPRLVIVELPSQPLYDVLHLDADIIVIVDPLHPYDVKALELLQRRAHVVDNLTDALGLLGQFASGGLAHRRSRAFMEYYLRSDPGGVAARELIADVLRGVAAPRADTAAKRQTP